MIQHGKIQHGKIQAGDIILDAEIDIETKASEEPKVPWFAGMKDTIISLNMTIHGYDGPNVVEGSIARPITDEGRLLK